MLWMWRRMHGALFSTQPSYSLSHTHHASPHTATTKHPSPVFHRYIALLHKMRLKIFALTLLLVSWWLVRSSFVRSFALLSPRKFVDFDETITHITIEHDVRFDNANDRVRTLRLVLSFRRQTNDGPLEGGNAR